MRDDLQLLFDRVLSDTGPEGAVALNLLRKRIPAGASVFIMTKDYSNPLMFVVEEQRKDIDRLQSIITDLRARLLKIKRAAELAHTKGRFR